MRRRFTPPASALDIRFEMTPLLDVIFLLLTFFIFSYVLMVKAHILPVKLPLLQAAEPGREPRIAGITLDGQNRLFLNREPVGESELAEKLRAMAKQKPQPSVFVALEDKAGERDRAPTLLRLIDMLRQAGIENFYMVGQDNTPNP